MPADQVTPPPLTLEQSARYCQQLTRRRAGNFYFAFLTLPKPDRRDMSILYAFMRHCDDIGDDPDKTIEARRTELEQWRTVTNAALAQGDKLEFHSLLPAFVDLVERKAIPHEFLQAVITGVERDLHEGSVQTFEELEDYCYHVAGVVGRCCVHVWGLNPNSRFEDVYPLADSCGLAFQLTNILRDLQEDSLLGRCYLPQGDLDDHQVTRTHLLEGLNDPLFQSLMKFEVARAREYYAQAQALFDHISPTGKPVLGAMIKIYGGILDEIERRHYDVFTKRVSLSYPRKVSIALGAMLRRSKS
ncbi:All-trans-phytoene synthase [Polystyrenella longa]|uniref:All-trans-phytoene synthase n=1 Tax=Polystyrenella longa TaxID=2528007 RepID=A0A518CJC6_9PLAN|nr:phytoene/squalene synthase family protein [Polystyrenella longa]QDU79339.1 All-trans-phytoene synthase [Polystyrenella longa]